MGCSLQVETDQERGIKITGNRCPKGEAYAIKEITSPTRTITTTVKVIGGDIRMVSVKTKQEISKGKIMDCMKQLQDISVPAPVHIGDIIITNIAETGVDVIATKEVHRP
jgi:CxxC motif-containing protein